MMGVLSKVRISEGRYVERSDNDRRRIPQPLRPVFTEGENLEKRLECVERRVKRQWEMHLPLEYDSDRYWRVFVKWNDLDFEATLIKGKIRIREENILKEQYGEKLSKLRWAWLYLAADDPRKDRAEAGLRKLVDYLNNQLPCFAYEYVPEFKPWMNASGEVCNGELNKTASSYIQKAGAE